MKLTCIITPIKHFLSSTGNLKNRITCFSDTFERFFSIQTQMKQLLSYSTELDVISNLLLR